MWEDLRGRVFGARVVGGLLGSWLKASPISSADMSVLWSIEQGTTEMEMERP